VERCWLQYPEMVGQNRGRCVAGSPAQRLERRLPGRPSTRREPLSEEDGVTMTFGREPASQIKSTPVLVGHGEPGVDFSEESR
jgi:hypothetical protein